MATAQIRTRTKLWSPSTGATTTVTDAVFQVKRGERVLWASFNILVCASVGAVGTVSLGDGTSTQGFIANFTPTAASAGLNTPTAGSGALFNPSGGKLYSTDDTVDAVFTYTSGGVIVPVIRFVIATVREYPN